MTIQEIAERVDFTRPFNYNASFELSGNTDTDSKTIQIGADDFLAQEILIEGRDSAGDDILNNVNSDVFRFNMKNESGEGYTKEPITLRALKELVNSERFRGWLFRKQNRLELEISTDSFPASNQNTYPVKVYVNFMGYRLK